MKCTVRFYLLNADFSEEQFEIDGKETDENHRYEWEDELKLTTEVDGVDVQENAVFPLQGSTGDGKEFSYDIEGMTLFRLFGEHPAMVACSASLLDRYEVHEAGETIELEVFLKDYEPMANPIPGIYIASQSFPEELIEE